MASGDLLRVLADRLKDVTPFESERLSAELMKIAMGETGFRCATCRWWHKLTPEDNRECWESKEGDGRCGRVDEPGSLAAIALNYPVEEDTRLNTAPDFGCIQWEARDGE